MKKIIVCGCIASFALLFSCKKTDSTDSSATVSQQLDAARAIPAGTTNTASRDPQDSIYAVQSCGDNERRTLISFSSLNTTITTYLSTNYNGYTAVNAAQITNKAGDIVAYIAIINYNGKPVAVKFDALGGFVKVLELIQGIDLFHNRHFHHGGCFDIRDGLQKDTIPLASLNTAITGYLGSNYPTDSLVKAFQTKDSSIIVITKDANGVLYANIFSSSNTFIKRIKIQHHDGRVTPVAETALPASIGSYLNTTYPGYTFKHAFSIQKGGVLQGYVVIIDANNSKYAVEFDALGNFLEAHIIH